MPRVLCLSIYLDGIDFWTTYADQIQVIDPLWTSRSRMSKLFHLVRLAPRYDLILFFYETHFATLFWLLHWLRTLQNARHKMLFVTLLCDVSLFTEDPWYTRNGVVGRLKRMYFSFFVRLFTKIVVHSRGEIEFYSKTFALSPDHFAFIPYFIYEDAIAPQQLRSAEYVLAAGRNRDFRTFVEAVRDLPYRGVLVGGAADRDGTRQDVPNWPAHVDAYFELPYEEYRQQIGNASVFVIPLLANKPLRSLGQIAAFEAVGRHIPIIAARTFHLRDYFSESEIAYYEPGDTQDLRTQIDRLMKDRALRDRLAQNAYERVLSDYKVEDFLSLLITVCDSVRKIG